MALYVDDIAVCSDSKDDLKMIKKKLAGVKVERDERQRTIKLTQESAVKKMMKKFGMIDCEPKGTPVALGHERDEENDISKDFPYKEIVGSLMYVAIFTRPDIAYAVNACARYMSNPKKSDEIAIKRIIRYLKKTIHLGIEFGNGRGQDLIAYVDSDWASSKDDRKSTTGFVVFFNGPISWESRR
jgi:hypothetical protein